MFSKNIRSLCSISNFVCHEQRLVLRSVRTLFMGKRFDGHRCIPRLSKVLREELYKYGLACLKKWCLCKGVELPNLSWFHWENCPMLPYLSWVLMKNLGVLQDFNGK